MATGLKVTGFWFRFWFESYNLLFVVLEAVCQSVFLSLLNMFVIPKKSDTHFAVASPKLLLHNGVLFGGK